MDIAISIPIECEVCQRTVPAGSKVYSVAGNPVPAVSVIDNGSDWPAVSEIASVRWSCRCLDCAPPSMAEIVGE